MQFLCAALAVIAVDDPHLIQHDLHIRHLLADIVDRALVARISPMFQQRFRQLAHLFDHHVGLCVLAVFDYGLQQDIFLVHR